ncbi:MAG: PQQ-dependent sugar dehydrogenase [Verrucomicrobiales bacterium]|nr:PQQ-dependent sugar dehydrogenase [Verrucomicrobiales bacterium]
MMKTFGSSWPRPAGCSPWRLAFSLLLLVAPSTHAASPHSAAETDSRRFELAPGLSLGVWAAEPQLANPVAFSLAAEPGDQPSDLPGVTAFVAETHRYGVSVLDITQNTRWLLNDLSFRSVADRVAFLETEFGTNRHALTADSELIRRLNAPASATTATASIPFATGFNSAADGTAAGILAREDQLWFGNIPNLWRFDRWFEPGTPSPTNQVAFGFGVHIGVTGHDLHGLIFGPDGRLYMSFGDRGLCITNREGVLLEAPDSGGVLRCEPDGRRLEIFCRGLRNPQELAFDDFGNLFTVDNDTSGADPCRVLHLVEGGDYGWRASYQHMKGFGPWVQEGLWTGAWDGTLPPAGMVSQGPAGLTYYPGTGFGDRFKGRFLHCDFPGGIWSFSMVPRGSSFVVGTKDKVLWNAWPTDVEFGPDGALYVLDWVSGWGMPKKGRIYRLTTDDTNSPASAEVHRLLAADPGSIGESECHALLGHADRRIRLKAQWALAEKGPRAWGQLIRIARGDLPVLPRLHAVWALGQIERNSRAEVQDRLGDLIPLLNANDAPLVVATIQCLADAQFPGMQQLLVPLLQHPESGVRLAAVQAWASPPEARAADPHQARLVNSRGSVWSRIAAWFHADRTPATNRLTDPSRTLLPPSIPANPWSPEIITDPFLLHAATKAARVAPTNPTPTRAVPLRSEDSAMLRLVSLRAARRSTNAAVAAFLDDPDPILAVEAARAINDQPVDAALSNLAAQLETVSSTAKWLRIPDRTRSQLRPNESMAADSTGATATNVATLRQQFLRRVLNAHFRLGRSENAKALADFAAARSSSIDSPETETTLRDLRVEALFLLGSWEVLPATPGHVPAKIIPDPNHGAVPTINPENWPGWFDRVIGLWRPLPPRGRGDAHDALLGVAKQLFADPSGAIALAAVDAAVRLQVRSLTTTLFERFKDARSDPALRRAMPKALADLEAPELPDAVRLSLVDADPQVRAAAIPFVDRLGDATALPLLEALLAKASRDPGEVRGGQSALRALGKIKDPRATRLLLDQFDRLSDGQLPPAMELDLLTAAQKLDQPEITARLARRTSTLPADDTLAAWREVLHGGDAAVGRAVFFDKPETQCSRCHRVAGDGGTVGPALDGVASRRDARFLLESVVHPNAQVATGFENAVLTLTDGTEVAGTIRAESAEALTIESGEDGVVAVPTAKIAKRQRALSAMPEGLADLLSRHELRDLLAYLQSLR